MAAIIVCVAALHSRLCCVSYKYIAAVKGLKKMLKCTKGLSFSRMKHQSEAHALSHFHTVPQLAGVGSWESGLKVRVTVRP